MDRIEKLLPRANSNPGRNMQILLSNLSPSTIIPDPDKYYVFVYKAKTKGIVYDMYPFVVCTSLHRWGFIGFNFHWNAHRRYSWADIVTNLYEIQEEELNSMEQYPIAKFVRN